MAFGTIFRVTLAYVTATRVSSAVNTVNTVNTPVICGEECCPLIAGDSTGEAIGTACGFVEGETLRIDITLDKESCEMTETHICNIPAATLESGEPQTKFLQYFLDMETVYDFTCTFIGDSFLVAGHVTVECDDEEETSLHAYYEVEICCEELSCPTTTVSNDVEGPFEGSEFVGEVDGEFAFVTNVDFEVMAAAPSSADSSYDVIIEELKDGVVISQKTRTRTLVPGEQWFEKVSITADPSAETVGVRSRLEKRESDGIVRHLLVGRSLQGTGSTECDGTMEDEKEQQLLRLNRLFQCHETIEGTPAEVEARGKASLSDWLKPAIAGLVPRESGIEILKNKDPSLSDDEAEEIFESSLDQVTTLALGKVEEPLRPATEALFHEFKSFSLQHGSARLWEALGLENVVNFDAGSLVNADPLKFSLLTLDGAMRATVLNPVQNGFTSLLEGNLDAPNEVLDKIIENDFNALPIIECFGIESDVSIGGYDGTFRFGFFDGGISINRIRGLEDTPLSASLKLTRGSFSVELSLKAVVDLTELDVKDTGVLLDFSYGF